MIRIVVHKPTVHPQMIKRPVGRASVPAAFGGTGFQPVHCAGKMPVPPRTFQTRATVNTPSPDKGNASNPPPGKEETKNSPTQNRLCLTSTGSFSYC